MAVTAGLPVAAWKRKRYAALAGGAVLPAFGIVCARLTYADAQSPLYENSLRAR